MLMSYPHIRMLWIIIKLNSSEDKSICYRFKMGCHFICIIMEICAGKKFLAVGINTNNEEQYLFTTFPGHELTIGSNGSTRSTHKRKLHCMVLDTRMHPFYSKQELPSKKSKLDWDTPVQKLLWISTLMSRNPRSRKQPRNLPITSTFNTEVAS